MTDLWITAIFWKNLLEPQTNEITKNVSSHISAEVSQEKSYTNYKKPAKKVVKQRIYRSKNSVRPEFKDTTLVFAPHPDDEVLCCSQRISEKIKGGENVKIIFMTNGDALSETNYADSLNYGRGRREESIIAAQKLGLNEDDLIFLGFPDGHLDDLDQQSLTSEFTGLKKTPANSYFAHTPFTRSFLDRSVARVLEKFKPYEIYIPSDNLDTHPDHQTTGEIVKRVYENEYFRPEIFEYFVHGQTLGGDDNIVDKEKLSLIRGFRSQFHDVQHREFLESYAKTPEIFYRAFEGLAMDN